MSAAPATVGSSLSSRYASQRVIRRPPGSAMAPEDNVVTSLCQMAKARGLAWERKVKEGPIAQLNESRTAPRPAEGFTVLSR